MKFCNELEQSGTTIETDQQSVEFTSNDGVAFGSGGSNPGRATDFRTTAAPAIATAFRFFGGRLYR